MINTIQYRNLKLSLLATTLASSCTAFGQTNSSFDVVRLNASQPIISQALFEEAGVSEEGENINGPSLIRVPDWISPDDRVDPSANYYLYFASHIGDYIRMAWASDITGPWNLYQSGSRVSIGERGVLDNDERDINLAQGIVIEENHLASPDVHVDNENQRIVLYFHSGSSTSFRGNRINEQLSWVSFSDDGLEFIDNIEPVYFGPSYFRVFATGGDLYAFDNSGIPKRALDASNPWAPTSNYYSGNSLSPLWESHPNNIFQDAITDTTGLSRSELRIRHSDVRIDGNELQVFYSQRGDSPERIMMSTIDLNVNSWRDWTLSYPPVPILQATSGWEGGEIVPSPSEGGAADENVNELRDPYVFEDSDGALYMIYTGRGEDGIGLAALSSDTNIITTLSATDDSFVRSGRNNDLNFGNDDEIRIKGASNVNNIRSGLVRFNLNNLENIQAAVVRLYATRTESAEVTVYKISSNWDESDVSDSNRPAESEAIATITMGPDEQWYEWDVTEYAQDSEDSTISFYFRDNGSSGADNDFSSREGDNPPELKVLTR